MIEVVRLADGWSWTLLSFCGRVLVQAADLFPSDVAANDAAKSYRSAFWSVACAVDHRMGACI